MKIISAALVIPFLMVTFTSCKKTYRCKCDVLILSGGGQYSYLSNPWYYSAATSAVFYNYTAKNANAARGACNNDHAVAPSPIESASPIQGNFSIQCNIE